MTNQRLTGRFALVTGGGSGIGRAVCQLFAREGASAAVLDLNGDGIQGTLKTLSSEQGNKHCSIIADVSSEEQTKRAVQEAEEKLGGRCTILVNCAGIHRMLPYPELNEQTLNETFNVNLKGVILMTKHFLLSLTERGKELPGSIVNISSLAARVFLPCETVYAASKAGVVAATKTTAAEYGRRKIRCNAILPGMIQTPMLEATDETIRGETLKMIPLGRFGKPEEVANACLFFASDESSYITGATLDIAGGASGIGRAVCQVFAREGARVAVLDINADGSEETLKSLCNHGNRHCAIKADVTSEEQVKRAVKEAEEKLGQKCTILVNSAGVHQHVLIRDFTEKHYHESMDLNLKGVVLMTKGFLASLTEEGGGKPGSIINISSAASRVCASHSAMYSASKAGLEAVSKTTAIEHGKYKVRCNVVSPGYILTPMLNPSMKERREQVLKLSPLGRIGQPEEVANACLFFASEESSYITGAVLEVTGGLMI